MTAAVLEECGKPLQLLDLEIPRLRGQVLVKIAYSAICRSQLMEINGLRGHDQWLPHLLGHEASGVVIDVGDEVKKVKAGDEVILTWIKSSGIEAVTPQYSHNGRAINAGPITTFSTHSIFLLDGFHRSGPGRRCAVWVCFSNRIGDGVMSYDQAKLRQSLCWVWAG